MPFLILRGLLAVPGEVRRLGARRLIWRWLAAGVLGLAGLGLGGSGLYVLFGGPYVAHDRGAPLAVSASTTLPVVGNRWQTASPGVTLVAAGATVEAVFDPNESASPGYLALTHPWPQGVVAGGNGLRLRASSDAELYIVARLSLAGGGAYKAEANLPAGDGQALVLEPFLPALDAAEVPAGLDWGRVTDLTLVAYPGPTQTERLRLSVLGLDVVDVAPSSAWSQAQSEHVVVWHHPGDEAAAQAALQAIEARYATLTTVTGHTAAGRVPILLAADHAELERLAGLPMPAWAVGRNRMGSVVLLTPRRYSPIYNGKQADDFSQVASHEVSHLLVNRAVGYRAMWATPVWLHEGLATYLGEQVVPSDLADVRRAAASGQLPALATLADEAAFNTHARWAYSMAGDVVRYLVDTYGAERVPALLQALRQGQNAEAALEAVYGLSPDDLDTEWRAALGSQTR